MRTEIQRLLPSLKRIITIIFTILLRTAVCTEDYYSDKTPDVIFKYYNKDHPNDGLIIFASPTIEQTALNWRQGAPVKIITHGWMNDDTTPNVQEILHAYLQARDYNLITVDWSESSKDYWYPVEIKRVRTVGKLVADLINVLIEHNLVTWANLHLIGHSAGSHVMGIAGANVVGGKVGRITALDAAKPGFQSKKRPSVNVLDTDDAEFVDAIHVTTNMGFSVSLGHADFWPNGKRSIQPGCKGLKCSHARACRFFAESILIPDSLKAWQCNHWSSFKKGHCKNNPTAYMGEYLPRNTRGNFYLRTNEDSPFGRGDFGDNND